MKTIFFAFTLLFSMSSNAQNIKGAWERYYTSDTGEPLKNVVIFSDGYQVLSTYHAKTGAFINCNGGTYSFKDNTVSEHVEFDSNRPERINTDVSFQVKVTDSTFTKVEGNLQFTKIDDGTPGALQGAWLMSGRVKDGAIQQRDTSRPRKTMKLLSGTRFQWIAYNTETKQFMGTGGGTYTTVGGVYTENIDFFSKDSTRVGASLQFNFELKNDNWHHTGNSSKGKPIHEIWSRRQ
ncbi:membrane or secreted protein [Cellulophaga baltica]|uniref:membrane or secreted protein n=1 Tax=Cellulophaga TaxID=104264 RepID=UPI001C07124C|nr:MULTISPECIES: membrane or secreted protein [Cellulophaga]MBU2994917.1 membrane or secreted protein [Cellulophaga baltica]MDO6766311.1 membrane or secreted protein [Cellulophaga sp. 1_MG-2023]